MTMKPEIKEKWLTALRSGDYNQGKGVLRDENDNYCCLGVLCEVVGVEWNGKNYNNSKIAYQITYTHDDRGLRNEVNYAPPHILDAAEFDEAFAFDLAGLNDKGLTFAEIADLIEREDFNEVHDRLENWGDDDH